MSALSKICKAKLPLNAVISVVVLCLACAGYVEGSAYNKGEKPEPKKVSCVNCHTDKKTLAAIAEKSGDPLYLVHSGDLTKSELQECLRDKSVKENSKNSKSDWGSYKAPTLAR